MSARLYYTEDHDTYREQIRRFVSKHVQPYINDWDEACTFPRELYKHAAEAGYLGTGFPEQYGGMGECDAFFSIVALEELSKAGSGGLIASLMSHGIGSPPIVNCGSDELKERLMPSILSGEKISALAITEPSGGSDVANIRTTAVLDEDGEHYIVNGSKTFITSGMRADYYTVAVRTGEPGLNGVSLLVIEKGTPGFEQTELKKMGWWCSDTATLHFDNCRVPTTNLVGKENEGFLAIMLNFNNERIALIAQACAMASVCIEDATDWAKQRETFGKPLVKNQVIRHKLVDMHARHNVCKAYLEQLAWRCDQGEMPVAELCMAKTEATAMLEYVAGEAVQILGGAGYMRGTRVERIFRETKVLTIGGGSAEVMKDLAARQLHL